MVNKWFMLIVTVFIFQGCHTFKGSEDSFKKVKHDCKNADNWIKENLW